MKDQMKELKDAQTQKSPELEHREMTSLRNNSFHLLDIPAELAFIYSKLDAWEQVHTEKNISKINLHGPNSTKICQAKHAANQQRLPADINSFSFNKFIQIYIKVSEITLLKNVMWYPLYCDIVP